jgi:phosphoglycerate dehydrogenase-like enzyme
MPVTSPPSGPLRVVLAMDPGVAPSVLAADTLRRLAAVTEFDPDLVVSDLSAPSARAAVAAADVFVTGWGAPVLDGAALDLAPRLRAVFHAAGSVKPFVRPAVWDRGLVVSSAADANAYPVAQYTLSMVLLSLKRTWRYADDLRRGQWRRNNSEPLAGAHQRTVGVVGASRIGRLVLPLLAAQGFRLVLADPTISFEEAQTLVPGHRIELVELDTLCRISDLVTIHAPELPETRHLFDNRRLSLLRDDAILINSARGSIVDTDALVRHAASGRIDAVLDVTDPEPLPPGHPLLHLPNVLVTPHIAGALGNEVRRLGDFAADEVERYAAGLPLVGAVTAGDLLSVA